MPDVWVGSPQNYGVPQGGLRITDTPGKKFTNPYLVIDPIYNDIDFFTVVGNWGVYLNNVLKPEITLEHCTAYFIQSASNSIPINIGTTKDVNDNSLSAFLTYYVSGTRVNNYQQYETEFVPSSLTYIKFDCNYNLPGTAAYYFVPGQYNKGGKINLLPRENLFTFAILSSVGFTVVSAGDYEIFFGKYKDRELLVNVRSEYLGTSGSLPPVSSWRLPLSSFIMLPSLNNQEFFQISYQLDVHTVSASIVTIAKY